VEAFIMWGFWDPGHWRGNAPLFDEDWIIKDQASPWFDLVRGEWMPDLQGLTLDEQGRWVAEDGLISGIYDATVTLDGQDHLFQDLRLTEDGQLLLVVPEPGVATALLMGTLGVMSRRR
jgi:hypothetical protein